MRTPEEIALDDGPAGLSDAELAKYNARDLIEPGFYQVSRRHRMAVGRRFLSAGWAVRIRPSIVEPRFVAWLNAGGGYSPERYRREVWGQRWEAEDAARPWKDCKPVLVRVRFYSRRKP